MRPGASFVPAGSRGAGPSFGILYRAPLYSKAAGAAGNCEPGGLVPPSTDDEEEARNTGTPDRETPIS